MTTKIRLEALTACKREVLETIYAVHAGLTERSLPPTKFERNPPEWVALERRGLKLDRPAVGGNIGLIAATLARVEGREALAGVTVTDWGIILDYQIAPPGRLRDMEIHLSAQEVFTIVKAKYPLRRAHHILCGRVNSRFYKLQS